MTSTTGHACGQCSRPPRRPRRLRAGDRIAVCTPSGPGGAIAPARFARGVRWLEESGFDVVVGAQAYASGRSAGSARARADEVNAALHDGSVRAVVTAIGGLNTNGVLPYVDFAALERDPKILLGYSDITALLLAAYARTGVVTFHGPTLMPELAEFPEPLAYTWEGVRGALMSGEPLGLLTPPSSLTEELLLWDEADDRPRTALPNPGWSWLAPGSDTGRLVGGNLDTVRALLGTPYMPCTRGAVLFWETCTDSLASIECALDHLDAAGVTADLAGMVVGRSFRVGEGFEKELQELTAERYTERGFPIVAGVDLGHSDPMLTLPIGVEVILDSERRYVEVLSSGVAD